MAKKESKKENKPSKNDAQETYEISLAEAISKITVTNDTPNGLLAEWSKDYAIDNCRIVSKIKVVWTAEKIDGNILYS